MGNAVITALERNEKGKKVRKQGFIPGVIYGQNKNTVSVKFDRLKLMALLKEKGETAKIALNINEQEKFAIIKEVGRDMATNEVIHIDLQVVEKNENIKLTIPVIYTGTSVLRKKGLFMQVYVSNIEISGNHEKMPDYVSFDVSDKKLGDKIRVKDIKLEDGITVLKDADNALGAVSILQ